MVWLVGFSFYGLFGWILVFYVGSLEFSFCGLVVWILVFRVGWLDPRFGVVWLNHHFVGWLFGSSFCRLDSWILILWDNWL